jgi:hypothetical protein
MPAQRTTLWARCHQPLRADRPGPTVPLPAYTQAQVVDYLRSCFHEAADTTDTLDADHLDAVMHRARTLVRRRRLRDTAALATLLAAAALAGFALGAAL